MRNPASNLVVESCIGHLRMDVHSHMMEDDLSGLRRSILTWEKASYRLVILKRAFPDLARKTIVRSTVKCSFLTIIDSDVLEE